MLQYPREARSFQARTSEVRGEPEHVDIHALPNIQQAGKAIEP